MKTLSDSTRRALRGLLIKVLFRSPALRETVRKAAAQRSGSGPNSRPQVARAVPRPESAVPQAEHWDSPAEADGPAPIRSRSPMPDPQAPVAGTHPSGFLPPADTGRAVRTERAGHDGRAIEARLGGGLLAAPKSATEGWSAPNESMAVLQAELEQLRAELQTLRRLGQEARIDHLQAQLANSQNHD